MDKITAEQRSRNMSAVKGKNTRPEKLVRSLAHKLGFRFRLHRKDLPGKPDIVFPRLKKVIFVHGCFWHMHGCPRGKSCPTTRAEFWEQKRRGNVSRDQMSLAALKELGWQTLVIWECELRELSRLEEALTVFLEDQIHSAKDRRLRNAWKGLCSRHF